jgi:hypothetical protein
MSNDVKRHRRWRNWPAWILAFAPWIFPGLVALAHYGLNDPFTWKFWVMIGLCSFYTLMIIAAWQPWRKKD